MKIENFVYGIIIIFNVVTVLLYIDAPLMSAAQNTHLITLIYVITCLICWGRGYKHFIYKSGKQIRCSKQYITKLNRKTLLFFFGFYLLTIVPKYGYELYCGAFDIVGIITRIIVGFNDPSVGYLMERGTPPFSFSIYFIISIIDNIFLILSLLSWKQLRIWMKVMLVFFCILEMLVWFGKGTNFGTIMMIVTIMFVILSSSSSIIDKRKLIKYSSFGLLLLVISLFVFSHNMEGRAGGDLSIVSESHFRLNEESFLNSLVINYSSPWFKALYFYIMSYLVGGYTNLECLFHCDFTWCFFMGDNPSKANLAQILTGIDFESMNYPTLIELKYGIDKYVCWHSCYTWLANDFTIFGVPFVLYWIGRFTSCTLIIYRNNKDILSGIIFVILSNMAIFLFANNNYLSSVFYSFMIIFPIWFFTRYRNVRISYRKNINIKQILHKV